MVHDKPNEADSDHLEDETTLDADKGELVLRRLSHAQDSPYDKAQRKTIFHFRCTIQDKVCNLIIDRGSNTNVASTVLIEKLRIPTISYPKPCFVK